MYGFWQNLLSIALRHQAFVAELGEGDPITTGGRTMSTGHKIDKRQKGCNMD